MTPKIVRKAANTSSSSSQSPKSLLIVRGSNPTNTKSSEEKKGRKKHRKKKEDCSDKKKEDKFRSTYDYFKTSSGKEVTKVDSVEQSNNSREDSFQQENPLLDFHLDEENC